MKRVMVVDDSRFVREQIGLFLQGDVYEVCAECRSAEEALQMYPSILPDYVLMDIVLPEMDGLEAVGCILEKWPDARVVMVTSLAYDRDIALAKKAGAKSFLCKPFEKKELLAVLQEADQEKSV